MRTATTTTLLRCAAFGAVGAVILFLVSPLTSTAAVLNPVLYAAIAAVTMVMEFDQSFEGVIQISTDPLVNASAVIGNS